MKLASTAVYISVIAVSIAVAVGAFDGGADATTRAFVCGLNGLFAWLEIVAVWRIG